MGLLFSLQIHVCSLETGKPVVSVGGSPGDFTCINVKDAPPHLLVCGNKDRRYRDGILHYYNLKTQRTVTGFCYLWCETGKSRRLLGVSAAFTHKDEQK